MHPAPLPHRTGAPQSSVRPGSVGPGSAQQPTGIDATFHFPEHPGTAARAEEDCMFWVWAPAASAVQLAWRRAAGEHALAERAVEDHAAQLREAPIELGPDSMHGFRLEHAVSQGEGWWAVPRASASPDLNGAAPAADRAGAGAGAGAGTSGPLISSLDYGFLLDEDTRLLPDPRSRRQPSGPHGPSATVPARAAVSSAQPAGASGAPAASAGLAADSGPAWAGRAWDGSPVYELHIGTFTPEGTFDAAITRLDHLVGLGVGWVELLPVNTFAGLHNWGYDGVGWFAVQESYGGPAGYRRFIDAAHARGLGVLQDVVHNHLGPSGNYLSAFGPYLHTAAASPWGDSLNLDGPGSDAVRAFILDNLAMYVRDYGVDGFRLDAVHALLDSRALPILEDMSLHMDRLGEERGFPVPLIAESDLNDPRLITARSAGGAGLTGQWSDDFHHALHVALTGETSGYYPDFAHPDALAKVLRGGFFHDGSHSSFRQRSHGRPIDPAQVRPSQLVVCAQNHDQVGNRAAGERLSQLVDQRRLMLASVLLMLGPSTPMLFMGEEWGAGTPWQFFTDHREDWLQEAVSKGRRSEFARMGWEESAVPDPQDPATFRRSVLDWSEARADNPILDLHRALGRLRSTLRVHQELEFSDIVVARSEDPAVPWISLEMRNLGVLLNLSDTHTAIPLAQRAAAVLLDTADISTAGSASAQPAADGRSAATDGRGPAAGQQILAPLSARVIEIAGG